MLGIYIHIPFCVKKCYYCDFYSVVDNDVEKVYVDELLKEIDDFCSKNQDLQVDSIFFGGGTPSFIDPKLIEKILIKLYDCFKVSVNVEITMETNPKTFDKNSLILYKLLGVNRISMGLQSANDNELENLGRIHSYDEFLHSYNLLRETNYKNINCDIMFGLPSSTLESLDNTLSKISKLDLEHISAYALTISENTPIYHMEYIYPNDDNIYKQYKLICQYLKGYTHYEISNFAKNEEAICRHNMKYWNLGEYIGFGASAHSHYQNKRWNNFSNIDKYLSKDKIEESIAIDEKDELFEYIMLAFRTNIGVDTTILKNKFGIDFDLKYKTDLDKLIENNYLIKTKNGYNLTEDGYFISNSIIEIFI